MAILYLVLAAITIGIGGTVGVRALALHRRTRQAPELLVGLGLVSFALVAYPASIALGAFGSGTPAAVVRGVMVTMALGYALPVFALGAFVERMFRPRVAWARILWLLLGAVELAGGLLLVIAVWPATSGGSVSESQAVLAGRLMTGAYLLMFVWMAAESFAYHAALRRRLRFGLADPVTAHRFLLWGLGASVGALVDVALLTLAWSPSLSMLLQASSGLVSAVTWWLVFWPPEPYVAWLRARSGAVRAPSGEATG